MLDKTEVEQSIPQRFERQVELYGDRLAVRTPRGEMSYTELNRAANRIALAMLARLGDKEEPVALLFERDAQVVAAILASLKAGKIYVPLDPGYPRERNQYMLENSQVRLVLADRANLRLAENLAAVPVFNVDDLNGEDRVTNPAIKIAPDRLAYILYTSGSTGQPKGVMQTHRNVLHTTLRYTNTLGITREDRLSMVHSYCHVAAAHNTFGALLNGASLFPFDVKQSGVSELIAWLSAQQITIYHSTPTLFHYLVAELPEDSAILPSLRVIKLGGETVTYRDFELYRKHFPDRCLLHITLGATEIPMFCQSLVGKATEFSGSVVPTGHAAPDMEIVLLDGDRRMLEAGEVGEIAVKSQYLSPGYWRAADATASVFAPNLTGGRARVYRTGDLGYFLPDGKLVHAGRKDFQVKIRGHRVEIAEIEAALLAIAIVKQAAVVARENRLGEQGLAAFVVCDGKLDVANVRDELARRLPNFMVPATFTALDALPLTPNGKLDRRALPAPDDSRPELEAAYVAPRTPTEEMLAAIWAEVLQLARVGIHDNFFDLGGHSLLATQVIARVKETLQADVPLRALFEAPTVAGLSALIVQKQAEALSDDELAQLLTEAQGQGA